MPASAITTRIPSVVRVDPPVRARTGGRAPLHTPEIIAGIAKAAKSDWTSNGLEYNSKSSAQAAAQRVKSLLVEGGYYESTGLLRSTIYSTGDVDGPFVFAVRTK